MVLNAADTVPAVSFWVISIALLLWGVGGASIYVAYFMETPEEFARTAQDEVRGSDRCRAQNEHAGEHAQYRVLHYNSSVSTSVFRSVGAPLAGR